MTDLVPASTGRDIKCDIGQLANNASVTFRFGIQVPANSTSASTAYQTWFTASGNEGTSNQGSNQDAFFALGTITVDPTTSCSDANFFASGTVDSGLPNCDQPATLTGGAFATGAFASVRVTDTALCPAGVKCFGKGVFANVEFGAPVSGGLQWTVLWQKASLNGTPKGVIHFLDGYDAVTNAKAYETIDFKSTAQCPATIVANTKLPCLNGKPGFVTVGRHHVLPGDLHDDRQRDGPRATRQAPDRAAPGPAGLTRVSPFCSNSARASRKGGSAISCPAKDGEHLRQVHEGVPAKDQIGHPR